MEELDEPGTGARCAAVSLQCRAPGCRGDVHGKGLVASPPAGRRRCPGLGNSETSEECVYTTGAAPKVVSGREGHSFHSGTPGPDTPVLPTPPAVVPQDV